MRFLLEDGAVSLKHKDKARRKINYDRLRDVGYNSYEANRFKDFSDVKIDKIIGAKMVLIDEIGFLTRRS